MSLVKHLPFSSSSSFPPIYRRDEQFNPTDVKRAADDEQNSTLSIPPIFSAQRALGKTVGSPVIFRSGWLSLFFPRIRLAHCLDRMENSPHPTYMAEILNAD